MRHFALTSALIPVLLFAASLHAQAPNWSTSGCNVDEGNTSKTGLFGNQERVCELRSTVLPLVGSQVNVAGICLILHRKFADDAWLFGLR